VNHRHVVFTIDEGLKAIPLQVVRKFDIMDAGDPTAPPQFTCESCGGGMYPEYYKGVRGHEYQISDIRQT
jgi:hypothetical protein